jgi:mitochondrial fission protein ELM1
MGGPPRAEGMDASVAGAITAKVAGFAGSVLATASRRTGSPAEEAMAAALAGHPHRLFHWGDAPPNPYAGFLAWADQVVVTGDSVSMLSEALATAGPVFIADPGGLGPRHKRLAESLIAAGQARDLAAAPAPFARTPLDESGRIAAEIRAVMGTDDMRAKLAQQGSEPVGSTPEEFRAFVASEIPKWAELVRISGAKVE